VDLRHLLSFLVMSFSRSGSGRAPSLSVTIESRWITALT